MPARTQARSKLSHDSLCLRKMTENKDAQFPKTPGKEQTPRDQPAKSYQPPTPPPKTTFKPAVPKFGNALGSHGLEANLTRTGLDLRIQVPNRQNPTSIGPPPFRPRLKVSIICKQLHV